MPGARKFFFACTDDAVDRMAELFDFVWPAVSAFVHSRSKAHRYRALEKSQRRSALTKAFQSPRTLRVEYRSITGLKRANLEKAFIETEWKVHEQVFARLVLVNVFAIYEGWLDDLLDDFNPLPRTKDQDVWRRKFIDATQFPYTTKKHENWTWAISELANRKSVSLNACVGPTLKLKKHYRPNDALSFLRCYRFFKELRNAVVHKNGKASKALMEAKADYDLLIATNTLPTNSTMPNGTISQLILGGEVELSLFGVVGFNDVILSLMSTLDVEAGLTTFGEETMARFFQSRPSIRSLSGNVDATARRMANDYGLFSLENPTIFIQMLASHGVSTP